MISEQRPRALTKLLQLNTWSCTRAYTPSRLCPRTLTQATRFASDADDVDGGLAAELWLRVVVEEDGTGRSRVEGPTAG